MERSPCAQLGSYKQQVWMKVIWGMLCGVSPKVLQFCTFLHTGGMTKDCWLCIKASKRIPTRQQMQQFNFLS
jgi:hypothetical protein